MNLIIWNRMNCINRDGQITTHHTISMNHMPDLSAGTCTGCGSYVRKVPNDYRWAATIKIIEWP